MPLKRMLYALYRNFDICYKSRRSGKSIQGRSTSFFQVSQRLTFLLSLMLYKKKAQMRLQLKIWVFHSVHNINTATMFLPPIYIFSLRDSVRRVERERERESEVSWCLQSTDRFIREHRTVHISKQKELILSIYGIQ